MLAAVFAPDIPSTMPEPQADTPGSIEDDAPPAGATIETLTPTFVRQFVRDGLLKLAPFRAQRKRAAEICFGQHYANDPVNLSESAGRASERRSRQPINLGMQQLRTLLWYLTYSSGQPEITGRFSDMETQALVMNKLCEEDCVQIGLTGKLQSALIDCILGGLGIIKTGVKAGSRVFSDGVRDLDPGTFFAEPVSLDDFVSDPMARNIHEARANGFRNRISKSATRRLGLYGRDPGELDPSVAGNPHVATRAEADAMLSVAKPIKAAGDRGSETSSISSQTGSSSGSDTDIIEVWELEWRFDGELYRIVLPCDPATGEPNQADDKFLLFEPCATPDKGSLRFLSFLPAVDNLMPVALEGLQRDLANCADAIARKITRAAIEAKKGVAYEPALDDDMKELKKAPDNFLLRVNDAKKLMPFEVSGMMQELTPGMEWLMQGWNNVTGNLQLAAGSGDTGTSGDTATEFQGLMGRVQGWMQYLQRRMEDFCGEILADWAWYFLTDPLMCREVPLQVAAKLTVKVQITPEVMNARFVDFYYRVRSCSMRPVDPVMEANQIIQFIAQALPNVLAGIQAGVLKPSTVRVLLRKLGVQEADQIVNDIEMMAQQQMMQTLGPPPMWAGEPGGSMMPQGMAGPPGIPPQMAMGGAPVGAPGASPVPTGGGGGLPKRSINLRPQPRSAVGA